MVKIRPGLRKSTTYSEQKVARILAAAHSLFTRSGYEVTSMDSVAAAAEVGKATVYAHFGSKSDLFAAVIAAESGLHHVSLEASPDEGVGEVLRRFGRQAFDFVLTPGNTAVFRMVAAESARFPELGRIFYENGPARLQQELARFLALRMETGEIRHETPNVAACQFLAVICGDLQIREFLAVGAEGEAGSGERDQVLRSGIEIFLRAYRPDVESSNELNRAV